MPGRQSADHVLRARRQNEQRRLKHVGHLIEERRYKSIRIKVDQFTVFLRLDALHVLDASALFDARWSGPNTF